MKRRYVLSLTIVALTAALLFQFQNCAPATPASQAGDSDVRLIEDFSKSEIQFVSEDVQVHDEASTTGVGGLCNRSRNGARLRWAISVTEQAGRPLVAGEAECRSGQFSVRLEDLPNMVCGVKHLLVVEGEWGASTFTHILRR